MHKWNVTATLKQQPLLPATFESNEGRYFRNSTVVFIKVKLADGPKALCHDCNSSFCSSCFCLILIDSLVEAFKGESMLDTFVKKSYRNRCLN